MPTQLFKNKWHNGKYDVTEIEFVNSFTESGDEDEKCDASYANDGSITCYLKGTKLIVHMENPLTVIENSMFTPLVSLERISGLESVTTIGKFAFYYTPNVTR